MAQTRFTGRTAAGGEVVPRASRRTGRIERRRPDTAGPPAPHSRG